MTEANCSVSDEPRYYNLRSRNVRIKSTEELKVVRLSRNNQKRKRTRAQTEPQVVVSYDSDSGFAENSEFFQYKPVPQPRTPAAEPYKSSNWRKALNWVENNRDNGLYIECCNLTCKKLRYCEDYHDPVDVPELWFCHNLGNDVTCETPQEEIPPDVEEDLIENLYTAGSLVWARWPRFPWWPAMVCDSPDTLTYYSLKPPSQVPVRYHVIYFSNIGKIERSWITVRNLKSFKNTPKSSVCKRMVYRGIDFTAEVDGAYEIAQSILENELTITERLAGYSFLSNRGGYSPSSVASLRSFRSISTNQPKATTSNYVSDSEDMIPGTPEYTPKRLRHSKNMISIEPRSLFR